LSFCHPPTLAPVRQISSKVAVTPLYIENSTLGKTEKVGNPAMNQRAANHGPTFPPDAPTLSLSAEGPEGTVRCILSRPVSLLGARRDCHLPLPHPDISKIHAAVVWTGAAFIVRDLASRTGTRLNGRSIRSAPLRPADVLEIGPVKIRADATAPYPQPPAESDDGLRLPAPVAFEFGGRRIETCDNALVIGRRHTADLVIDNPDVSVAHALVFAFDGRLALCDLGSRSGTLLNGQRIESAFLRDQDVIEIGGEKLLVRWTGPKPGPAEVSPAPGSACPDASDPQQTEDLDQTIALVQSQLGAACARIMQRTRELQERERKLEARELALEQARREADQRISAAAAQAAALEQQRKALETERQALERLRGELQEQKSCLDQRQAEVTQQEEALRQQAAKLEATSAEVAAQREALSALQREIRDQQAAAHKLAEELAKHQTELEALAKELQARDAELKHREALLAQREARDAELLRKIEQFKAMLRQAGELFANTTAPVGQSSGQTARPDSASASSAPPAPTPEKLPAPVVNKPLFGPGVPPSDWPRELQERFRVLRRLSHKSDQELLAQVWAERAQESGPIARPN
jgi:pSer/pThr/pTyr-binding forkhead associated (FHA) protein/archaellum component FlaC